MERIGALIKILSDQPNRIITLNYFCDLFGAAKSSISEDIVIAKQLLEELQLGTLRTVAGAAGGVKFLPLISRDHALNFLQDICPVSYTHLDVYKRQDEGNGQLTYLGKNSTIGS